MKSKITFKVEATPTEIQAEQITMIKVMRDGKQIGQIWSEQESGTTPYPHEDSEYCFNSIQICGFDRMSGIWACGPFRGHKDCVVHFIPTDEEYYHRKLEGYHQYVKRYLIDLKDLEDMQNFNDWVRTDLF